MFCNKCGKEIPDGSEFCNHCGKSQKTEEMVSNVKPNVNREESGGGCFTGFLKFILISGAIILIILVVIKLVENSDSTSNIIDRVVERDVTSSDYSVSTSQDLTSYSITITPNKKMNYCSVEVKLYDKNGKLLYSDTITKNDLKVGSSYTYTFNFGFTNSLTGSKIRYNVSGKCVDSLSNEGKLSFSSFSL